MVSKIQTKKQLKQIVSAMGGRISKALSKNDMMPIGKYRRYTIKEVLYSDPAYIIWMHTNTLHVVKESILQEAHKELNELQNERNVYCHCCENENLDYCVELDFYEEFDYL